MVIDYCLDMSRFSFSLPKWGIEAGNHRAMSFRPVWRNLSFPGNVLGGGGRCPEVILRNEGSLANGRALRDLRTFPTKSRSGGRSFLRQYTVHRQLTCWSGKPRRERPACVASTREVNMTIHRRRCSQDDPGRLRQTVKIAVGKKRFLHAGRNDGETAR